MAAFYRISVHRLVPALTVGLLALGGLGAPAGAATRSQSTTRSQSRAAPRAGEAATQAEISHDLLEATGHSAAQLSTRAACGSAEPNRIQCYARVLTVKSTGRAATLLHAPDAAASAPQSNSTATGSAPQEYTAAYLQSAYDTTWLSANRGSSDTVAIVDAYGDSSAYSDMEQFRTANGLPQIPTCTGTITTSCFELVSQTGSTTNLPTDARDETGSWNVEESLDIDAVSSICPLCKIVMVEAQSDDDTGRRDLEAAVSEAANLGANQISLSWGEDTTYPASDFTSPYSSITTAAILAAAGDDTYPGPDVGYPAALPDVTAVGGTSLSADPTSARGFGESAWSVETCSGGASCATESGCDTSQPIPAYQSTVTTDCDGRAYNDISADGDPDTGLEIYDSQPGDEGCDDSSDMCIVGGTSLATPLTAALEAVTGITTTTPAWTYGDASLLNDIVTGSDGTCPATWYLICNAASGWDGPTGNGSISGDLATGGPGFGGSSATGVNGTDVTLGGGLYPNGESTSYEWQYWPSSGSSSAATITPTANVSGSNLQSVSTTLCNTLTPGTTYDYELTASNSSASAGETGYEGSFTTAGSESAPTASSPPSISGSPLDGQTLTGVDATWNDASCNSTPTYVWQESASSTGPWTTVGTGQSYTLQKTDDGQYIRFAGTESNLVNPSLSATVGSTVLGPISEPSAASSTGGSSGSSGISSTSGSGGTSQTSSSTTTSNTTTTSSTGNTQTTVSTPTTTTTTTSGVRSSTTTRFYRCARTCTLIDTHGTTTYTPQRADYGRYIKVVTTVSRIEGDVDTETTTTRWIGPVSAATAGSIVMTGAARIASSSVIRGATGKALAQVRLIQRRANKLTLVVRPAGAGHTQVWAYVIAGGQLVSGTAARSLNGPATVSLTLKSGQTVRLVAVRT